MRKRFILGVFVILIIIGIIVSIVLTVDEDTGDFNIKYIGNAKKYETFIKQGVNKWSSIGTGGITIIIRITDNISSSVVATTSGNDITISENIFKTLSANLKVLTIAHEIGHALGIGTWSSNTAVDSGVKVLSKSKYPKTAQAYVDKVRPSGITISSAPLENGGHGSGSDIVHWEDNPLYGMERDLMTYKIKSSANVISIVDLTFLDEIGRKVDLSQAQSLKGFFSAVIAEYVFEDEESPYLCGTCHNCHEH